MRGPGEDDRVGVVLAAGLGSRLAGSHGAPGKPMVRVGGAPLLTRALGSLEVAGCSRAVIVLGHEAERIRSQVEERYAGTLELVFVLNPGYRQGNGLSVLCARPHAPGRFLLTMADHVLEDEIMHLVRNHQPIPGGATLCVDYDIDGIFDLADATRVLERDGLVRLIGKQIEPYNCIDTGVFVCTGGLMDALDRVAAERGDASLSEGVQALASRGLVRALDVGDAFWQDVDTPEMLAHAERQLQRRARRSRS